MPHRSVTRLERHNDFSAVGRVGRKTGITLAQQRLDENGLEEMTGIFSSPAKVTPKRDIYALKATPTRAASTRKSVHGSAPPPRSASPRKSGISGSARRSTVIFTPSKQSQRGADEQQPTPSSTHSSRRLRSSLERVNTPTGSIRKSIEGGVTLEVGSPSPDEAPEIPASTPDVEEQPAELPKVLPSQPSPEEDDLFVPQMGDDIEEEQSGDTEDDVENIPLPEEVDDEDADQTFEPASPPPEKEPTPKANSRNKRKSGVAEIEEESASDSPRPKKSKASKSQSHSKTKPRAALQPKNANAKLSRQQSKDVDEIVRKVRERPGQGRSLYILRRETPADEGVTHTRSGRVSVKPLAYWRNERCVYGGNEGPTLADGARFPLNSIKEIIRTDEVIEAATKKPKKPKKRGRPPGRARSKTVESVATDSDQSDGEDTDAEPWETEIGTFRGTVSKWDSVEQAPIEDEEEIDLAYAPAAIQTREVKSSSDAAAPTFKYAKLLSTKFFGTGIVDLPPGGHKRPKNSRKMHMSFFVVTGRVTVRVGPIGGLESKFSVGKGGFWQVPRGNQYSIENELDKSAKIFFSQGCEPAPETSDE